MTDWAHTAVFPFYPENTWKTKQTNLLYNYGRKPEFLWLRNDEGYLKYGEPIALTEDGAQYLQYVRRDTLPKVG